MKAARLLLVACLLAAGLAFPLGSLAQGPGSGPVTTFIGKVESRPEGGEVGTWAIGGRSVEVVAATNIVETMGPAEVGALVFVQAVTPEGGALTARVIRVLLPNAPALARLGPFLQQLQLRLRFARSWNPFAGWQYRARTGDGTGSQTQQQTQNRAGTQQQTQTQNQEQTQTQNQEQTQTQNQGGTQEQNQGGTQEQNQGGTQTQNGGGTQAQEQTQSGSGTQTQQRQGQ